MSDAPKLGKPTDAELPPAVEIHSSQLDALRELMSQSHAYLTRDECVEENHRWIVRPPAGTSIPKKPPDKQAGARFFERFPLGSIVRYCLPETHWCYETHRHIPYTDEQIRAYESKAPKTVLCKE